MQIQNVKINDDELSQIQQSILNNQSLFSMNESFDVFDDLEMAVNSADGVDYDKYTEYETEPASIYKLYAKDFSSAWYFVPSQFTDVFLVNDDITLFDEKPLFTFKLAD